MGDAETVGDTFRRLDPRYVTVQRMTGWVLFAIVMVTWALVFAIVRFPGEAGLRLVVWMVGMAGALAAPLLIWLAAVWPSLSYRHYAYRIDADGLEIRAGVFFRRVTTVPRSRVQHTDVAQGPIERRFGLGRLVVYTAGTQHAQVSLPGLEHGDAIRIRDTLLPKDGTDAV